MPKRSNALPPPRPGSWGSITGTLGDQSDLTTALASKVPTTRTVNGHALSADVTIAEADIANLVSDLGARELLSHKNAANGYAGLDASSKLTGSQQVYGTTANTAAQGNDARLSDARTPTAHHATHESGGADAIKLDDLAAPDDNTDLNASTTKHGLLRKLSNVATEYLDGTGAWSTPAGGGAHASTHASGGSDPVTLAESQITNLTTDLAAKEDVAHKNAASGYAGLDGSSKLTGSQQVYGTAANTACQGNDSRLSDSRTPTAHHTSHESGGGDALTLAQSQITNLTTDLAAKAAKPATSTITTTGTQTALALPTGSGELVIFANNATLLTVQGIAAGTDGQRLTILSIGAGQVDFAHQNGSATAANRLINQATSGPTSLAAGYGRATFRYDANAAAGPVGRWRLEHHDQGDWITPAYAAGNFTAAGAMTWTVDAGDVTTFKYWLRGRTLDLIYAFTFTSIGGTNDIQLNVTLPAGYVANDTVMATHTYKDGSGANYVVGQSFVASAGETKLRLYTAGFGLTNWTTSTNTTHVYGAPISIPVQ